MESEGRGGATSIEKTLLDGMNGTAREEVEGRAGRAEGAHPLALEPKLSQPTESTLTSSVSVLGQRQPLSEQRRASFETSR